MKPILEIKNLYTENEGIQILREISLSIYKGEIIGIVGESGCGKSTLLRTLLRMMNKNEKIVNGSIVFNGEDMAHMSAEELRKMMGSKIGVVFQNPGSTLNPIRKIGIQFVEAMQSHVKISKKDALKEAEHMLEKVNLKDCKCILNSYPFELSGGMKQRVAIALAMIMKPELLVADEPTSALDVTVQKQVVDEMMKLRDEFQTSILIVTHSMGVVSYMVDKVAVMYAGKIIEYGEKQAVLERPMHPYTKALMNAIPKLGKNMTMGIEGAPPMFMEVSSGCSFAKRCPIAKKDCQDQRQSLRQITENRWIACSHVK